MVVPSLMLAAGRARRLTPFANAQIDQRGARAAPSGGVPERQISSLAEMPGMTQQGGTRRGSSSARSGTKSS